MKYELAAKMTNTIPIYKKNGEQVSEIKLPEKIMPVPAKRGGLADSSTYYKGAGIVYNAHLVNKVSDDVRRIGKTNILYEKYLVCYPNLVGKHGIFMFLHQIIFSDCEGGCGKKEQRLLLNPKLFEYSAIEEIVNVIPTGIAEHNIYAYRLKKVSGGIDDTAKLVEYILRADFNTAWDKNLWGDVYCFGYVRDVADWFISKELNHKIGTIYALLNSLYREDLYLYALLLQKLIGRFTFDKYLIVYYMSGIV